MAQLDEEIKNKIDDLMDKSNDQFEKDDFKGSIDSLLEAWKELPDPKETYDDSYHIAFYICDTYLTINDYDNAIEWANKVVECDPDRADIGEKEFLAGRVFYESGKLDKAKDLFAVANEKSKGRCFEDEDEKYKKLLTKT